MANPKEEHPFYGIEVIRRKEHAYIQNLLKKYRHESVSDELKAKIWDELQMEKHKGNCTIPFKVSHAARIRKNMPITSKSF